VQAADHEHDGRSRARAWISARGSTARPFTHRAFITQTWDLQMDGFPWGFDAPIAIPKAACASVHEHHVFDTDGVTQTWSSALYTLATRRARGPARQIVPAYFQFYR